GRRRRRGCATETKAQQVIIVEHIVATLDQFESCILKFISKRAFSGPHHLQDVFLGDSLDPLEVDQYERTCQGLYQTWGREHLNRSSGSGDPLLGEVSVAVRIGSWFANQTDRVRLSDVRAG